MTDIDEGCYGKFNSENITCSSRCPVSQRCYSLTLKLTLCKEATTSGLVRFLVDDSSYVREAAKERFDELEGITKC